MALVDPTGGVGYAFGQKLPSTHMTTIAKQQPNAIDGVNGGSYTPAASVYISGVSALRMGVAALILSGPLKYDSHQVNRLQSYAGNARTVSGNWSLHTNDAWRNTAVGGVLWVTLDRIPHNATLTEVRTTWKGAAGHAALPVMPKFELFRVSESNVRTSVASVSDTTATVPVYESAHIVYLSMSEVIDLGNNRYVLEITGELGANFVAGAQPLGVFVTLTVTEQAEV